MSGMSTTKRYRLAYPVPLHPFAFCHAYCVTDGSKLLVRCTSSLLAVEDRIPSGCSLNVFEKPETARIRLAHIISHRARGGGQDIEVEVPAKGHAVGLVVMGCTLG